MIFEMRYQARGRQQGGARESVESEERRREEELHEVAVLGSWLRRKNIPTPILPERSGIDSGIYVFKSIHLVQYRAIRAFSCKWMKLKDPP